MNKITFPLRLRTEGPAVGDLQQALSSLEYIIDPEESATQRFGLSTRMAVTAFQENHKLEPTGEVDTETAALINHEIESGAITVTPQTPSPSRELDLNGRGDFDEVTAQLCH